MHRWFRFFFFQAEDGIRGLYVTGVQTCALPISTARRPRPATCAGPCRFAPLARRARPSGSRSEERRVGKVFMFAVGLSFYKTNSGLCRYEFNGLRIRIGDV